MAVNPVPKEYQTLTPYFLVKDAERFLKFLQEAFDAKLVSRHDGADGRIMHAEAQVGTSRAMFGEPPPPHKPTYVMMYLYVPDADAAHKKALAAGAKSLEEVKDQFYGDRSGAVEDAEGNTWWLASRKEELSEDEMKKRAASAKGGH